MRPMVVEVGLEIEQLVFEICSGPKQKGDRVTLEKRNRFY
jgi:hypothetical protein